jgi:hypothetical protein
MAVVSAVGTFASMPYTNGWSAFWSLCIIIIDIAVIWALTVHGRDIVAYE